MNEQSRITLSGGTPEVEVPRDYNATHDLVERNLREGRGGKTAIIDDAGSYTYEQLSERVDHAAGALSNLGVVREQRVTMCMLDSVDFLAIFWGALKIGAVPVPLNTLLTTGDYDFMLQDSRAEVLVVSSALLEKFEPVLGDQPFLRDVVVAGDAAAGPGRHALDSLLADATPVREAAATVAAFRPAMVSSTCPWDLDGDEDVGITDFLDLLAQWGTDPAGPPDFDSDGTVGINDFLELLGNWGACPRP